MDNKNNAFDEELREPVSGNEIEADELAVYAAGLTHPEDLELEAILAEDWDSVPDQELPEMTPEEALNQFLYGDDDTELPAEENLEDAPTQVISMAAAEEAQEEDAPAFEEEEEDAEMEDDFQEDEEGALEEALTEESEEVAVSAQPAEPEKPMGKRRPKMKKGYGFFGIPHIISTAIWLALIVAIGVSLGRVLWVCCADVMAFGKPQVTAYVDVKEGDDIEAIAQKMADANLIRYPNLFVKFAEITEKQDRIKVGIHELGSHLDYNAMLNNMVYTRNARQEVKVTFPEGYNCAQMFRILEDNGVCSVADLEEYCANGELGDYWFLEGVTRGDKYCLEGYLAPDTYMFYTDDKPENVIAKFLNEFDDRFTDIMKEDFAVMQERYARMLANRGYSSEHIAENALTLHQVVTVASVIERETANDAESYEIAGVFYNRVTHPSVGNMGSDATVYYAVGDFLREKTELTQEDLDSDSPYNTRKARGIPPGPICNPGAYSLYAALDPNDNDYLYFVYDRENNQHRFSSSYEEHLRIAEELGV